MTTTTTDLASIPTEILKTDCKGRIRFPARIREELLNRFEQSSMSGAEFAAFYGIKYPTFATWRQNRERERKKAAGGTDDCKLVEVVVRDEPENQGLRVELPGGASMRITGSGEAQLAAELLKELSRC